jgi:hypothetical protein
MPKYVGLSDNNDKIIHKSRDDYDDGVAGDVRARACV